MEKQHSPANSSLIVLLGGALVLLLVITAVVGWQERVPEPAPDETAVQAGEVKGKVILRYASAVDEGTAGTTTRNVGRSPPSDGPASGVSRSPRPRPTAIPHSKKNGTSEPRSLAISTNGQSFASGVTSWRA